MNDTPLGNGPRSTGALGHETLASVVDLRERVTAEVARVYIGDVAVVQLILAALLARGHVLLEGVPGLAKTTLANAIARALGCDFRRIQFTPDLLPADITGTYVLNQRKQEFELRRGPLFAQVVLADEINRAPAKTQSALLEAMQERQTTIEGESHRLPDPFLVLATQNPVEQEGVYALPEAQIDRFLIRLRLDYPSPADELRMLMTYATPPAPVQAVSELAELLRVAGLVDEVHVEERVLAFAVRLVIATREHGRVALGASPRATLGLVRMARAWALLQGRDYASPDDLRTVAPYVLEHRVMVTTDAAIEGSSGAEVIDDVLRRTPVLEAGHAERSAPNAPIWAERQG
ncbi:MAG: MoxR family ATPase [Deltaproteobacteria bacterium]|nr:MoxR family ATPase [Deltaproteobacteria bacterium]